MGFAEIKWSAVYIKKQNNHLRMWKISVDQFQRADSEQKTAWKIVLSIRNFKRNFKRNFHSEIKESEG